MPSSAPAAVMLAVWNTARKASIWRWLMRMACHNIQAWAAKIMHSLLWDWHARSRGSDYQGVQDK
jgi:hypothetical protein